MRHDPISLPAELGTAMAPARGVVLMLRLWLDGPEAQQALWSALARERGAAPARALLKALERFLGALARGLTRPLKRHAAQCPCLGADEAALAALVLSAGRLDTDGAWARALDLVMPETVPEVLDAAIRFGVLVHRLDPAVLALPMCPPAATLH